MKRLSFCFRVNTSLDVEDKVKVFANSKSEDCVDLYFSAQRKYKQVKNFIEKLF